MAWYAYEFWVSEDGQSWRDNTDCIPHPAWRLAFAIQWADGEVRDRSSLGRFAFVQLRRREGTYRPRGNWRTVAEWRHGTLVGSVNQSAPEHSASTRRSKAKA